MGNAVELIHLLISQSVPAGGIAVDATAGNGYDTLFLARLVGPEGKVYAIDVQEQALTATRMLLDKHGLGNRVVLFKAGHEDMDKLVEGPIDAAIFNLGYLPGGDHSIVTRTETTLKALRSALDLLRPGGRAGLVAYTGHSGGREEFNQLEHMAASLDSKMYQVIRINIINRSVIAPVVIVIEKAGGPVEIQAAAKDC